MIEPVVKIFKSHSEADAADRAYYASLTPQQRLAIMLEIIDSQREEDDASQRVAPVCRIVKRSQRWIGQRITKLVQYTNFQDHQPTHKVARISH